jgi:capsular polysaccharide biosynthesis protein
MNPEDAAEYTEGLGQIVAGAKRQMEEGARLGVPQALGLTPTEWVETRLGAASNKGIPERREPVSELTARNGAAPNGENPRKSLSQRISHALGKKAPATSDEAQETAKATRVRLRYSPRHWLVIPVCAVLGMLAGLVWGASATPVYQSQSAAFISMTALPVDDPNHNDPFGSSQFALQRVQTYAQIATSPQVLQAALRDLHRGDAPDIAQNVKVSSTGGVMLWVTVEDRDAQSAAHLADAVMASLVHSVSTLEADGGQRSPIQLVPVQPALVPDRPESSGALLKTLGGLVLGLALGGGAFYFIRSRRDAKPHQGGPKNAAPAPKADPKHNGKNGVVVLRVGDGRDFARRVGR